jgi:hypothetical protein
MRPIRQRRTLKPAGEEIQKVEEPKGGSTVLVVAMLVFLGMGLLCLGGAFVLLDQPDSSFRIDWLGLDVSFGRLMGLSTIFMAMTVMLKGVIQMFRR